MRARGGRACKISQRLATQLHSRLAGNRRCGACARGSEHANEASNAVGAAIRAHVPRVAEAASSLRANMRALLVALPLAAAQCPSPYEGTSTAACFLISDFPATFSQCQQHCESNGGSLATIKDKQEDDYVRQLVTTQRAVWIGLFESGEQDESGVWEWVNDCVEINQCVGCTSRRRRGRAGSVER